MTFVCLSDGAWAMGMSCDTRLLMITAVESSIRYAMNINLLSIKVNFDIKITLRRYLGLATRQS